MHSHCQPENNTYLCIGFRQIHPCLSRPDCLMVALQFLVLPVLVRIQVRQHLQGVKPHRLTPFFFPNSGIRGKPKYLWTI